MTFAQVPELIPDTAGAPQRKTIASFTVKQREILMFALGLALFSRLSADMWGIDTRRHSGGDQLTLSSRVLKPQLR